MFALFYVLLAPFVGAFADAVPKGQVMFVSNAIKVVGCLLMLFGSHPLLAYAIVGLGAAAYSPAKYGILTELLPPSQLVKANGWIEGLTIAVDHLGHPARRPAGGPQCRACCSGFDLPLHRHRHRHAARSRDRAIVFLYIVAALFNLYIPRTEAPLQPLARQPGCAGARLLAVQRAPVERQARPDLAGHDHAVLGRVGNLRVSCFAWAAAALGYGTTQASTLVGVVAIGTAVGAIVASLRMRLDQATGVIPLGIVMGVLVIGLNFITNVWVAAPFLILLGAMGGFLVVPMNALLQHRGHNLMGAGRSIAVQNFNEQACILGLGAFYAGMTKFGLSAFAAITDLRPGGGRHRWADPPLAPAQLRAHTRRGGAPAGHRAHRQALRPRARMRRAWRCPRRCWRLVFNAFVWGVSWWPFRQLEARACTRCGPRR